MASKISYLWPEQHPFYPLRCCLPTCSKKMLTTLTACDRMSHRLLACPQTLTLFHNALKLFLRISTPTLFLIKNYCKVQWLKLQQRFIIYAGNKEIKIPQKYMQTGRLDQCSAPRKKPHPCVCVAGSNNYE